MHEKEVGAGCQSINDVADAAGEYKPEAAAPARRRDTRSMTDTAATGRAKDFMTAESGRSQEMQRWKRMEG
jgi:hypothetical protein